MTVLKKPVYVGMRVEAPPVLLALGAVLLGFGVLFREEAAAAVRIWEASTAYNHCWLVAPIAAWLAWQRRHRLRDLAVVPWPLAALLLIPTTLGWLVAERLGIMEGRQLAGVAMLWVALLVLLGWSMFRAMAAPLLYLVFLVPFGAFATPLLQSVTAWMIDIGLDAWGITHYRDGLLIETVAGTFHVAEACAGLRFLIAALAFGALYALVLFRTPGRRLVVMALALIVPVVANGIRALAIVVAAEYLGSAEAATADHIIYGWGFFSAVMLVLVLIGLPFRQDHLNDRVPPVVIGPANASRPATLVGSVVVVLALAACGPGTAVALQYVAGEPVEVELSTPAAPVGCVVTGPATLRCGSADVTLRLLVFPPRVTWGVVAAEQRRVHLGLGSDEDTEFTVQVPGQVTWHGRLYDSGEGAGATATWLAGRPVGNGIGTRARQALNSLSLGEGGAPVVAVARLQHDRAGGAGPSIEPLIRAVLEAQTAGLVARAAARSAAP